MVRGPSAARALAPSSSHRRHLRRRRATAGEHVYMAVRAAGLVLVFCAAVLTVRGDGNKMRSRPTRAPRSRSRADGGGRASGTLSPSVSATVPSAPVTTALAATSGCAYTHDMGDILRRQQHRRSIRPTASRQGCRRAVAHLGSRNASGDHRIRRYQRQSDDQSAAFIEHARRRCATRSCRVPQAAAKFSVDSKGDTQPDPDASRSRRVTITVSWTGR